MVELKQSTTKAPHMEMEDSEIEAKRPRLSEGSMLAEKIKNLSSLERLPKELLWKIIDFRPEEALCMRQASHAMRTRVDEYSMQSNVPLVEKLSVSDYRLPGSPREVGSFCVQMTVAERNRPLFFLRLSFVNVPQDYKEKIKDFAQGGKRKPSMLLVEEKKEEPAADEAMADAAAPAADAAADAAAPAADDAAAADAAAPAPAAQEDNSYMMEFNYVHDQTPEKFVEMEFLGSCCGRRIAKVAFGNIDKKEQYDLAAKILNDTQITHLHMGVDDMTDVIANELVKAIRLYNVDDLTIQCCRFAADITTDSVGLLKTVASQVRSLHIYQTPTEVNTTDSQAKVLFGTRDVDWAPVIVDMFAGRLDKLHISNRWYPQYLSGRAADSLLERIPNLGKKVWFEATCSHYTTGLDQMDNGHVLKADAQPAPQAGNQPGSQELAKTQILRIKHETREKEKPMGVKA